MEKRQVFEKLIRFLWCESQWLATDWNNTHHLSIVCSVCIGKQSWREKLEETETYIRTTARLGKLDEYKSKNLWNTYAEVLLSSEIHNCIHNTKKCPITALPSSTQWSNLHILTLTLNQIGLQVVRTIDKNISKISEIITGWKLYRETRVVYFPDASNWSNFFFLTKPEPELPYLQITQ